MRGPKIIAVVGMAGSGKGTVVGYLEREFKLPKVYFGGMVYEEVRRRGLDITNDEEFVREDMRVQEGKEVLAKRAAERAKELYEAGEQIIVFDGLYSWSEYRYLRDEFGDNLTVVAVFTPRQERYARAVAREDARRTYTLETIEARDIAEIENIEKGGPIAIADHTLLNSASVGELLESIDELVSELELAS